MSEVTNVDTPLFIESSSPLLSSYHFSFTVLHIVSPAEVGYCLYSPSHVLILNPKPPFFLTFHQLEHFFSPILLFSSSSAFTHAHTPHILYILVNEQFSHSIHSNLLITLSYIPRHQVSVSCVVTMVNDLKHGENYHTNMLH